MFLTRLVTVTTLLATATIGCSSIALASDDSTIMRLMMACPTIKNVQIKDGIVTWISDKYSLSKDYMCIEETLVDIWVSNFPAPRVSCLRPKTVFVGDKSKLSC